MRKYGYLFFPLVLLGIWAAIYLGTISGPALLDDADSFHAEAVREMVQSGDWVTLRLNNGIRYLEKSPLMYWMAASFVSLFGLHDWAMRLPLAIFTLFMTFLLWRFGTRFWGEKGGFYSGLVFVTSLGPYAFTRIFLPDVMLSFFLAFSLYMYIRIVTNDEKEAKRVGPMDLRCLGFYISVALCSLTKGLTGFVLGGTIIFFHVLLTGNWKVLRRLQIPYGIVVFLVVAAPWHIAAALANSDFLWFYFIREHFLRYLGLRFPKDYDTVPRWLFWTLHLVWLFPWSAFFWGLARNFPKAPRPADKTQQVLLFLYLWIFVVLLFLAFGTTQEYYTFPTLAAFALLLGKTIADLDSPEGASRKWAVISLGAATAIAVTTGAGMIALTWIGNHSAAGVSLSSTLTSNPENYNLAFGHIHDLTPATFANLAPLVYRTAAFLIIGPLTAFAFALWRRWTVSFLFLALMMVGLAHSYTSGMAAFEPVLSSRNLAKIVEYYYQPDDKIVINDFYEKGSTLNYYTGHQVYVMNSHFGVLWYGLQDSDAPKIALNEKELLRMWNEKGRVFLFSEKRPLREFLARNPGLNYRVLAEDGGKSILINW